MSQRDTRAFTILVREHTPMLIAYLRTMLFDAQAVEDIYQETMVTAWRQLESFDPNRPFAAWVRGIARRHTLEHYRRVKRHLHRPDSTMLEEVEAQMVHIESRPGDTWMDKVSALNECIDGLGPQMKQAVILHYQEGLSTEMVASKMETTREAVKKRLQRGRKWLLECLRRKSVFQVEAELAS